MKFQRKPKRFKKCPRCGNKCLSSQSKCEECGLLFSRLEFTSNKAAKKKIRHFDTDFVIQTKDLPSDVKYWKLLVLAICTGLFGGHYYYVGKYIKGALMSLSFVYLIFCTVFNAELVYYLETYYLYAPIGVMALAWMISLVFILSRKFKVPVIVEMPASVQEEMKKERAEYDRTKLELAQEKEKLSQKNAEKKSKKNKECEEK